MTEPEPVDALRADGHIVHLRELTPHDLDRVVELHERSSDRSLYLRYFVGARPAPARYLEATVAPGDAGHHAVGAFDGRGELIGLGVTERLDADTAEFALLVRDDVQHLGVGTLLLEDLVAAARHSGVRTLVADVLAENARMLEVLRHLGLRPELALADGAVRVRVALDADGLPDAVTDREQVAQAASLRPLLAPASVVVVGASDHAGSVGADVVANLLAAGFTGGLYVVHPRLRQVLGVRAVPTAAALPVAPELAVIAVRAPRVPEALRDCGLRGVRAAVLLGAGFAESGPAGLALQDEVLAIAREHDMRLLGPNCIGVLNNDPAVRLDATFGRLPHRDGPVAIMAQSGAFGLGLVTAAHRVGLGVSKFVSLGNKADVGGNDLLLAWRDDPRTRVVAAYLESIGDPLRFARVARSVTHRKPVLVVKSGRTVAGSLAGRSHTAAAASPEVAVDALFADAGVLRVRTGAQLLDAARVLAGQPLPAGPRPAIIGNSGGPEILAADAAATAGLEVTPFDDETCGRLRRAGLPVSNPLDLGASAATGDLDRALTILRDAPGVDALVVVFADVAGTDAVAVEHVVAQHAATAAIPTVMVAVGCADHAVGLPVAGRTLPVFGFPEPAVEALGVAAAHRRVVDRGTQRYARPAGTDVATARAIVRRASGWLAPDDAVALLDCYGVRRCGERTVVGADAAVAAAGELGFPVVAKLVAPGRHKSDVGGVRTGLVDEAAVRAAVDDLERIDDVEHGHVTIQQQVPAGPELIVGSVHDERFGPLVMVGAGGVLTALLSDRAFRLAPLHVGDAAAMVDGLRCAPLLHGFRGRPAVALDAVHDLIERVATLAADLPEVAELDLNPVICGPDSAIAVDVRIRVGPAPAHPDPLVRGLRPRITPASDPVSR